MKSILKLIGLEVNFMKATIILIGLILSVFTASLLSVVSVLLDVPDGMYNYLTENVSRLTLSVEIPSLAEAQALGGDRVYGTKEGLTSNTTIISQSGVAYDVGQIPATAAASAGGLFRGYAINADDAYQFSVWDDALVSGEWPSASGQACISATIYNAIGANVNQTITIGDESYTVVGIYYVSRIEKNASNHTPPVAYYYVSVDENYPLDECFLDFDDSANLRQCYDRLKNGGYNPVLPPMVQLRFENIDLALSFFSAIAVVLAIVDLFILYSLMALFYRQRKQQICRMKMLGARNVVIAGIYCFVATVLVIFSTVLGSVLSIGFNRYYMQLCTLLFGTVFNATFRIALPLALFGVFIIFVLVLFAFFQRKIGNTRIAEEVRSV